MKIERKVLVSLLERLKPAIATAGSIAELKHIWWDGKFIYAFNNGMGIRIAWETDLAPSGVPGKVLLGLLESSSAKEVELIQDEGSLVLKMGRAKSTLVTLPIEGNPWRYDAVDLSDAVVMPLTAALLEGLRRACIVKAGEPSQTVHHGVVLFVEGGLVRLYSTDSVALAEIPVSVKLDKRLDKSVIPHEYIAQLQKLKNGEVKFTEDAVVTEVDGITVCSNWLDRTGIPDLPEWVSNKTNGDERPVSLPKDFGEGLKRAEVLAGPSSESKMPVFLTLTISKNEIGLTGKLPFGILNDKFPIDKSGSDGTIVVGLNYLKSLYKEAEEITITDGVLLLFGKNDTLFMIAEHEEPKAKGKATPDVE
jgi:hypothetical protein